MNILFLAWRDPNARSWYPIGRLRRTNNKTYEFKYLNGVKDAIGMGGFCPFPSFPDIYATYASEELFPLFANRLMPASRPDYAEYIEWMSIAEHEDDPIAILSRSGGERATDSLEVFSCPQQDEQGRYHIHFFVHGLRHMSECSQQRAAHLQSGDRLLLMHDFQNAHDSRALLLRTSEQTSGDIHNVGFCPRYLGDDIFWLLSKNAAALSESVIVNVERYNPAPAPTQFRLLCNMTVCWPDGFTPFSTELYQLLVEPSSK